MHTRAQHRRTPSLRSLCSCLVSAALLAGTAVSARAATYYVAPTGSDTTGDGSASKPFATIDHADAQSLLAPGDEVIVQAGTYTPLSAGVVLQNSSASAIVPIIYRAEGHVLLDLSAAPPPSYGFDVKASGIVLDGFEVKGAAHGIRIDRATEAQITGCTIHDSAPADSSGIWVNFADGVTMVRNVIYNIHSNADTPWGNLGAGLRHQRSDNVIFSHNVIDNVHVGILWYGDSLGNPNGGTITAQNNIIVNCTGWGAANPWSTDSAPFTVDHNLVWQNVIDFGNFPAGRNGPIAGDVAGQNPLFAFPSRHDYHLLEGSPALDVGIDVGLPFEGTAPDMGAYEGTVAPPAIGNVTGRVTANLAGSPPVRDARVQTADGTVFASTDSDGNYALSGLPAGNVSISVSARGFAGQTVNLTVSAGATVTANFSLGASGTPKTYYVDHATGNDNDPGTQSGPWKTISNGDAKDILNPGDTVIVAAGSYPQDAQGVRLSKRYGYGFAPVTYKAQGKVLIDQSGVSGETYGFHVAARGIVLDGFEVNGAQHGVYLAPGSHECAVNACVVHDAAAAGRNAEGVFVDRSEGVTVSRNVIYNVTDAAHAAWSPVGCGIRVQGGDNVRILNNTIDRVFLGVFYYGGSGFGAGPYGRIATFNNIVINCAGWGFVNPWSTDASKFSSGYNLVQGNTVNFGNFPAGNDAPLPSDLAGVDPLFVNAAAHDYRLQNSSPALNAGTDVGLPFVGCSADIGALESSDIPTRNVYYVDSVLGNDNNSGTSAQPWATIGNGDAKGILEAGDTVLVRSGTYPQTSVDGVKLTRTSGTLSCPVTYKAEGTVLLVPDGTSGTTYGFYLAVRNVVVDGFDLEGFQHGIYLAPGSDGCTVNGCVIHDTVAPGPSDWTDGVWVDKSADVTVSRNLIYNIIAGGDTPWGHIGTGIRIQGANNLKVLNNTIHNAYVGVFYFGGAGPGAGPYGTITTYNNIVVNCPGWGFANPWSLRVEDFVNGYNLTFGNVTSFGNYPASNNGPVATDVVGDPLFVDPANGDYHLQPSSPAIDKGRDVGFPYANHAPDIGALESPDIEPPAVVSARRDLFAETIVRVLFSEPLAAESAIDTAHYSIGGSPDAQVIAARMTGLNTVELTTTSLGPGPAYSLIINDVQDRAGLPIAPDSTIPIEVPPAPSVQSSGADGLVVIEAERFGYNTPAGGTSWEFRDSNNGLAGYSGAGTLEAAPDAGRNVNVDISASPRLDYGVILNKVGTHYVWLRALGDTGGASAKDSINVGLDGQLPATSDRITGFTDGAGFVWSRTTVDPPPASFEVATTGAHVLNVWMREDGFILDKLLLTTDANYTPSGEGPPESPRPQRAALTLTRTGGNWNLIWAGPGKLQSATEVQGVWNDVVPTATSPYPLPLTGPARFYRLVQP